MFSIFIMTKVLWHLIEFCIYELLLDKKWSQFKNLICKPRERKRETGRPKRTKNKANKKCVWERVRKVISITEEQEQKIIHTIYSLQFSCTWAWVFYFSIFLARRKINEQIMNQRYAIILVNRNCKAHTWVFNILSCARVRARAHLKCMGLQLFNNFRCIYTSHHTLTETTRKKYYYAIMSHWNWGMHLFVHNLVSRI